jgi:rod shape-determining protein MreB and related proteins
VGRDLAIDLGTANVLVYRQGAGIVFDEPSLVALHASNGQVLAAGDDASRMIAGEGGNVLAMRPLRDGTMTEYEVTARMLDVILRKVGVGRLSRPRVLACVPSLSSAVERRAIEEAVQAAGARQVTLVEEPLAAAIGAGLPVHEPVGSLIVDIGGGRSEMAIVSMGGVVEGHSVRLGGYDLDAAIRDHLRTAYEVAIGERAAEELKIAIGSAFPRGTARRAIVVGRELASGNTVEVELSEDELRAAMAGPIRGIVEAARTTLAEAPPELTHDVLDTGMFLAGGGSLLRGLDMLLAQECEVPVHVTEDPLRTVAIGAGRMLEHLEDYRSAFQLVRRR